MIERMDKRAELQSIQELILKRKARADILGYPKAILGLEPSEHHKIILNALEDVRLGRCKRLIICLPPGSAKSTYASYIWPSWVLGHHPDWPIILASHTQSLAESFSVKVRTLIQSKEYLNFWGIDKFLSDLDQARDNWKTIGGGGILSVGAEGAITGYRSQIGIIDDPFSGRQDADSPLRRQRVWDWYINDFWTRLKPSAGVVIIATRWHEDDLIGRLVERQNKGGEQWKIISIPMECDSADDPLKRKIGERLWSGYFTEDMVRIAKLDARAWSALYQQRPRPGSGGEFERKWIKFYHNEPELERPGKSVYILVDPSSGKRTATTGANKSDYTSICVIGLGEDGNYYLLDALRDRLTLTDRGRALMKLHRKWKPIEVRYEEYGMQADIAYINELQERENYRFSIIPVKGRLDKENRIRRMVPTFAQGKFFFPQTLYRSMDNVVVDLIDVFTEQEYLAFPVGRHDDMIDAMSRIFEPDLPLIWPTPQEEEVDGYQESRYSKDNLYPPSQWC